MVYNFDKIIKKNPRKLLNILNLRNMKKIVSLIVLVVLVASCSNDENEEILYKEIQKVEKNIAPLELSKETSSVEEESDTVAPPPPIYTPEDVCETCPIDPPKGGIGGGKPNY